MGWWWRMCGRRWRGWALASYAADVEDKETVYSLSRASPQLFEQNRTGSSDWQTHHQESPWSRGGVYATSMPSGENNSLCSAGNSTAGLACLNLFNTRMCFMPSSLKTGNLSNKAILNSASSLWILPISIFKADSIFSPNFCIEGASWTPGRSEIGNKSIKSTNQLSNTCFHRDKQISLKYKLC